MVKVAGDVIEPGAGAFLVGAVKYKMCLVKVVVVVAVAKKCKMTQKVILLSF